MLRIKDLHLLCYRLHLSHGVLCLHVSWPSALPWWNFTALDRQLSVHIRADEPKFRQPCAAGKGLRKLISSSFQGLCYHCLMIVEGDQIGKDEGTWLMEDLMAPKGKQRKV